MRQYPKEKLKWLFVVLAVTAIGFFYSFILDDLRGPPADQILENVRNINGFTIENLADSEQFPPGNINVRKYPDPIAVLSAGFHWVTYNGKTYRAPYGAHGMTYRPEFRAENDVLVRSTPIGLKGREQYQAVLTVATDTPTNTDFAIAERWYGYERPYTKQQWFNIESFLYEALKPGERETPVSVAGTSIQGFEEWEYSVPTFLPYKNIDPFFDNCEQLVAIERSDVPQRGITDGVWEWYPVGSLDYVFCREDSIFLLITNGHFMTTTCELVWLTSEGQFLGRFQLDVLTNAYRSPYRIDSFEFDHDTIAFDWLTGGIYSDSGPNFVPAEDRKPTRRAHITIDLTSVDRNRPVFNQRAIDALAYSRQSRLERKPWDGRVWPDHIN